MEGMGKFLKNGENGDGKWLLQARRPTTFLRICRIDAIAIWIRSVTSKKEESNVQEWGRVWCCSVLLQFLRFSGLTRFLDYLEVLGFLFLLLEEEEGNVQGSFVVCIV
ncbi:hypothetical protein AABB24_029386 [Solanum stoloniferum]|uniref:Uncharacterized protein n=1 Tax=Solanum stoloniferum TaxID=62892 RepID=A0ABD2RXS4_9SOLN